MRKRCLLPILALFFSVFIAGNLEAATYYIDGSKGNDSNPGSVALPWKTIAKANSTLKAGDTVYLRGGTYTNEQIRPSNSGTSDTYITFQNYNGESVTLSGHSVPLYLYGNDYIKIDGLRMENCIKYFVLLGGAHYNIIQNCTFYNAISYWGSSLDGIYVNPNTGMWNWRDPDSQIHIPNNYNRILNNIYEDAPDRCPDGQDQDCGTAPSDFLRIDCGKYNLVAGNRFGNCAHIGLSFRGHGEEVTNNVVRNNLFRNTYRIGLTMSDYVKRNLVEDNKFYDHGLNIHKNPCMDSRNDDIYGPRGFQCYRFTHYNIFRRNVFDNNGMVLSLAGKHNSVYHNTAHKQIRTVGGGGGVEDCEDNSFKNNIFANTESLGRSRDTSCLSNWEVYSWNGYGTIGNTITHNTFTGTSDRWRLQYPKNSITDWEAGSSQIYDNLRCIPNFADATNRELMLMNTSLLIDAGDWLATITSSTANGVFFFTVDDAKYFYDGWGIPGETGDVIKTAAGRVTTIQSINYDTNTLTISPAIDIVQGEGLALNYSGKAPDIGAHEYGGINAPGHLRTN